MLHQLLLPGGNDQVHDGELIVVVLGVEKEKIKDDLPHVICEPLGTGNQTIIQETSEGLGTILEEHSQGRLGVVQTGLQLCVDVTQLQLVCCQLLVVISRSARPTKHTLCLVPVTTQRSR